MTFYKALNRVYAYFVPNENRNGVNVYSNKKYLFLTELWPFIYKNF